MTLCLHPGAHRYHSPGTDTQGISLTLLLACKAEPHPASLLWSPTWDWGWFSAPGCLPSPSLNPSPHCICQDGPPGSIQGLRGLPAGTADGGPGGMVLSSPLGEARQLTPSLKTRAPVGVSLTPEGPRAPSFTGLLVLCPPVSLAPLLPSSPLPLAYFLPRVAPKSPLKSHMFPSGTITHKVPAHSKRGSILLMEERWVEDGSGGQSVFRRTSDGHF